MTKHLRLFALSGAVLFAAGCGSHGKQSGSNIHSNLDGTAQKKGSDGTPTDGNGGSTDPHPAACTTCASNPIATVPVNDPNGSNPRNLTCTAATAGTAAPCEGFCFVDPNVTPIWNNEPPSSGPAYPDPSYGFGLQSQVVPRGTWVHNLTHGYVVLTYNCADGCPDDVAKLAQIYNDLAGTTILITADPDLKGAKFAALAFGYELTGDAVDADALECFVMQHVGYGFAHGDYVPPKH